MNVPIHKKILANRVPRLATILPEVTTALVDLATISMVMTALQRAPSLD